MKNIIAFLILICLTASCAVDKRIGYHPQKNKHKRGWNQTYSARCGGPKRF